MPVLVWDHGTTRELAVEAIRGALRESGHLESTTWRDGFVEARRGPFGSLLSFRGHVTDRSVVLDTCSGLAGGTVLRSCRAVLERLFPGGEQTV